MRICLLGNNLTNLVLANVLANKDIKVDIFSSNDRSKFKNNSSRTLAISAANYDYLKEINKKFNLKAWPTEKIKIYIEKKMDELFEFYNKKEKNFLLVKYNEIYNFSWNINLFYLFG